MITVSLAVAPVGGKEGSWDASSQPYMWPRGKPPAHKSTFQLYFSAQTWLSSREAMTDSLQDDHCNSCMSLERVNTGLRVTRRQGEAMTGKVEPTHPHWAFPSVKQDEVSSCFVRTRLPHVCDGLILVKTAKLGLSLLLSPVTLQPPGGRSGRVHTL